MPLKEPKHQETEKQSNVKCWHVCQMMQQRNVESNKLNKTHYQTYTIKNTIKKNQDIKEHRKKETKQFYVLACVSDEAAT